MIKTPDRLKEVLPTLRIDHNHENLTVYRFFDRVNEIPTKSNCLEWTGKTQVRRYLNGETKPHVLAAFKTPKTS